MCLVSWWCSPYLFSFLSFLVQNWKHPVWNKVCISPSCLLRLIVGMGSSENTHWIFTVGRAPQEATLSPFHTQTSTLMRDIKVSFMLLPEMFSNSVFSERKLPGCRLTGRSSAHVPGLLGPARQSRSDGALKCSYEQVPELILSFSPL